MGLEEEFEAYKQTYRQSKAFNLEQDYAKYKQDMAQGGSIRQSPKEAPLSIGGVVGGVGAGLISGGNPAAAVIGAMGGEATQQLIEHAVGASTAPTTTGEAAQRIVQEGAMMGVGEGIGRGLIFLADKTGRPLVGHMLPEAIEAEKYLAGKTTKPVFLPAEGTDTRILDVLHNVAEYSVLGGGAIKQFKADRDKFFGQMADEVVGRYGKKMTEIELGRAIVDSAKRNLELARKPAQMLYTMIERQTAPAYVDVPVHMSVTKVETPVSKSAIARGQINRLEGKSEDNESTRLLGLQVKTSFQDVQIGERLEHLKVMTTMQERQISGAKINLSVVHDDLAEMSKIAKQAGGLADKEMGNTLLAFIQSKPAYVSYPVAKAIRTEVRTMADTLKNSVEAKNAPAIGKAQAVYARLTDAIRKGLAEDEPFLAEQWDEANKLELGTQQTFNNKLIRSLYREADSRGGDAPSHVASMVWNNSKDNTTAITRVRAAVDATDWQKMQRWFMQDAMDRGLQNGVITGAKLEKHLFGSDGIGEEAIKAGFDGATVAELKQFINVLKIAQAKQEEGTGRVMVQLAQGGMLIPAVSIAAGELGVIDYDPTIKDYSTAAGILLSPYILARVMTHPMGIKWLTEGFSTPIKGKESTLLATRILSAAFPRPTMRPAEPVRPTTSINPTENQR